MKTKYKIIIFVFAIEYFCILIMDKMNIHVRGWIKNAIGALVFLVPLFLLLYFLGKDKDIKKKYRIISKILFYFLIVCYLVGGIGKAISIMSK